MYTCTTAMAYAQMGVTLEGHVGVILSNSHMADADPKHTHNAYPSSSCCFRKSGNVALNPKPPVFFRGFCGDTLGALA